MSQISEKLLEEMNNWEVRSISGNFYHGCRHDDIGVDIENLKISGIK